MTGLEHSAADWITTEIEVRIRDSHGDDEFVNQTGVIRNISVSLSCLIIIVCCISQYKRCIYLLYLLCRM